MCFSGATAMWLAAGASAAGALYQGKVASDLANDKAREDQIQKAQVDAAAAEEAKRIRKAGERQAGAARAALAASGVDVDQGTAININQDITQRTQDDAYQTLLTGQRKSDALSRSADQSYKSAVDSLNGGVLSAGSSALRGYAGWKSVRVQQGQ